MKAKLSSVLHSLLPFRRAPVALLAAALSLLIAANGVYAMNAAGESPVSSEPRSPIYSGVGASSSVVRIRTAAGRYWLELNGTNFFAKGAVGFDRYDLLRACGANSVRSWASFLNAAQTNGLMVLTGLSFVSPRLGLDYADTNRVAAQLEQARATVRTYRGHPSVLMWAIGNEMEADTTAAQRVPVWKAVNEMAEMVHQEDPNHPVIAVIGGDYTKVLHEVAAQCPALDAVGLNSYADMVKLPEDVKREGWTKAYLVTEFGPRGHWQVARTAWGLPIEDSSSEKADFHITAYNHAVVNQPQCLGSYAFFWASKQEKTHTWYGLFLPDGSRTEAIDALTKVWTGQWPANRCPHVGAKTIQAIPKEGSAPAAPGIFAAGTELLCRFDVTDPESDPLTFTWDLRPDVSDNRSTGGDPEPPSSPIPGAVTDADGPQATIRLPEKPGNYRIFAYAHDTHGSAATANVPLQVRGPESHSP